jgi:outer membrane biosynthesis protein TonB
MLLVVFATSTLWAQQEPPPDPLNSIANRPSQNPTPTLSDADKSLACPAGTSLDKLPDGIYKLGADIHPPKVLNHVSASYPKEARKLMKKAHVKSFDVDSDLLLVVGTDGNPRDICVAKPGGYGLDGEAFRAAQKYRFAPATKSDGTLVPVMIPLEVRFRTM